MQPCRDTSPWALAGRLRVVVAALLVIVVAGCRPIGPRDDTEAPGVPSDESVDLFAYLPGAQALEVGNPVPDYPLIAADGSPRTLYDLGDEVIVLTLFAANETPPDDEILWRLAQLDDLVGSTLSARVVVAAVLLEDAEVDTAQRVLVGLAAERRAAGERTILLRAKPNVGAALAADLGVVLWQAPSGGVSHTFNTVVIAPDRTLADQFPGLYGWTPMDLVAAAELAAR